MYIDPRGKAFGHLDRLAGWQAGDTPPPVTIEWDLSNVCSLGCQSCHFAHTHALGPWAGRAVPPQGYAATGRLADTALVTESLKAVAVAGVRAIVWSGGGEPTMHPDFSTIIARARHWGLEQGVYTLGGHITADLAAAMGQGVSWVVVSLDAPDAETYAKEKRVPSYRWTLACRGIEYLAATVPVVGVSYLLHRDNWRRTAEMLALSRTLGATYTTFRPTIEVDAQTASVTWADRAWVTDALPTLEGLARESDVEVDPARFVQYRDWRGHGYTACHGIQLVTQITPDARVWVCPNRRGLPASSLGDLRTDAFATIWARHPRTWTDFAQCRVMCRLHPINETLAHVYAPRQHAAFL